MSGALADLLREIRDCRICIQQPERAPLPHEPRPVLIASGEARILIAGQAPGARVHQSRIPFTDRSGDRLREWLGVTRDEFYDAGNFAIVPMGFCFPGLDTGGSDLPPRIECATAWRERLMAAMPRVELTLAVGMYAQEWHLGAARRRTLTDTVRNWRHYSTGPRPVAIPLPHPSWRNSAWLRRNPWFERELLPFLKREVRRHLGR